MSRDEADRRKAVAQAGLAEVDLDERRRAVLLVSDAMALMADFAQALRSGLSNVAMKSAGRAATLTDPNEIREFFEGEINRSMIAAAADLTERWADLLAGDGGEVADTEDEDGE
jgi:hypothetical protein